MWLLDTHLVLWAAFGPQRLPRRARQLIESRDASVAFSDATLWKEAIKSSLSKPGFEVDASALRDGLLAAGFDALAIRAEHVLRVAGLPWRHRDPFDRLLVCQAAAEGLTLLTVDAVLASYGKPVRRV